MRQYTKEEFITFLDILRSLNDRQDNVVGLASMNQDILNFITDKNMFEALKNGESISVDEIKEDLLSNVNIDMNDVTLESQIEFLKLVGRKSDNSLFQVNSLNLVGNFFEKLKISGVDFQYKHISEIIECCTNFYPYTIKNVWKSLYLDVKELALEKAFKSFSNNINVITSIMIDTDNKIKDRIDIKEFLNFLSEFVHLGSDYVSAPILAMSGEYQITNAVEIAEFFRDFDLDYLGYISVATDIKIPSKEFLNENTTNILNVYHDSDYDMENIVDFYFEKTGIDRMLLKNGFLSEDYEVGMALSEILRNRYADISDKESYIFNTLEQSDSNKMVLLLFIGDSEFRNNISDEQKLKMFYRTRNEDWYVKATLGLFGKEFYEKHLEEIVSKGNLSVEKILVLLTDLQEDCRMLLKQSTYIALYNKIPDYRQDLALDYYTILPGELKEQFLPKVLDIIMDSEFDKIDLIMSVLAMLPDEAKSQIDDTVWNKVFGLCVDKYDYIKFLDLLQKDKQVGYFSSILSKFDSDDGVDSILKEVSYNFIIEHLDELMFNNNKKVANLVFERLDKDDIDDKILLRIVDSNANSIEESDRIKRYKWLLQFNECINQTLNLEMLDDEVFSSLPPEVIVRITAYPFLQWKILENKQTSLKVIKILYEENPYWMEALENALLVADNLPEHISNQEISKALLNMSMDSDNYFYVDNCDDYDNIKFSTCMEVLHGTSRPRIKETTVFGEFKDLSIIEQQRFAVLELKYGMDIKYCENLVKKYTKSIDKIDLSKLNNHEKEVINILKDMKTIYFSSDLSTYIEEIMNNPFEIRIKIGKRFLISEIEKTAIEIYEKLYHDELYNPLNNLQYAKKESVVLNDTTSEVDIIDLMPDADGYYDFKILARSDGAYSSWEEPNDFKMSLSRNVIQYHGNCKSLVANDLLAFARPKGPIFGYTRPNLCFSAPWDIISKRANLEFSLSTIPWETGRGIEILVPQEMINRTRHSHNEFVSEKLIYDEEKKEYFNDMPTYAIWVKESTHETMEDRLNDERWRMTKKVAAQLGIPVVVIDREDIVKSEIKKNLISRKRILELDSPEEAKTVLENVIIPFENNRVSLRFSKELETKYFTDRQRQQLYNDIEMMIDSFAEIRADIYGSCIAAMYEILNDEVSKSFTNKGIPISKSDSYLTQLRDIYRKKYQQIPKYVPILEDVGEKKNNSR